MIGKTIAHYEITGLLGKGGMGEVYLAHDAKLDRDVAFKVLPADMADDPERAARFEREARMLASLQHPNIASIYGYEHVDGVRFLTMELAEGENLTQRLERGRLPLQDVLQIAQQIATGLEAAHKKNIVHRDLKPANIMVDAAGGVKILDFGLARAYAGDAHEGEEVESSPTITGAMTQVGVVLGTAAYMSPEQAKGKSVDKRSDIWSFGVLVFEMLCGRKLFEGETMSETMADVMKSEIEWSMLPGETPRWLVTLLQRCLDRDPSTRLQSIGEARIALHRGDSEGAEEISASTVGPASRRWPWIGVGAALLVLAAAVVWHGLREAPPQPLVQSILMPPADWDFDSGSPFAVSPDGRRIAFVANANHDNGANPGETSSIWLRDLSEAEAHRLAGTDGASYPFWSPDGSQIAFFAQLQAQQDRCKGWSGHFPVRHARWPWRDLERERHHHLPEGVERGFDEDLGGRRHARADHDPERGALRRGAPVAQLPARRASLHLLRGQHHEHGRERTRRHLPRLTRLGRNSPIAQDRVARPLRPGASALPHRIDAHGPSI